MISQYYISPEAAGGQLVAEAPGALEYESSGSGDRERVLIIQDVAFKSGAAAGLRWLVDRAGAASNYVVFKQDSSSASASAESWLTAVREMARGAGRMPQFAQLESVLRAMVVAEFEVGNPDYYLSESGALILEWSSPTTRLALYVEPSEGDSGWSLVQSVPHDSGTKIASRFGRLADFPLDVLRALP